MTQSFFYFKFSIAVPYFLNKLHNTLNKFRNIYIQKSICIPIFVLCSRIKNECFNFRNFVQTSKLKKPIQQNRKLKITLFPLVWNMITKSYIWTDILDYSTWTMATNYLARYLLWWGVNITKLIIYFMNINTTTPLLKKKSPQKIGTLMEREFSQTETLRASFRNLKGILL